MYRYAQKFEGIYRIYLENLYGYVENLEECVENMQDSDGKFGEYVGISLETEGKCIILLINVWKSGNFQKCIADMSEICMGMQGIQSNVQKICRIM